MRAALVPAVLATAPGCGDGEDAASRSPSPPTLTITTAVAPIATAAPARTVPPVTAVPVNLQWDRVVHDEAVFGGDGRQVMRWVVAGDPGLVAVGADVSGGDADAAVWTSVDGVTWSRVPHDEAVFGGGEQLIADVEVGGPGLVAVGADGSGGDADAAVWTAVAIP